jgi:branched-chain amino acid transport system substrate-binding protein
LVREDDRCDAASAIASGSGICLIGGGCSNATFAAREAIETAKIPTLIFASVHDGITVPPAPNIYSTALTSTIESEAQVVFAQQQGAKRIAMISMKDAWGRARYAPLLDVQHPSNEAREHEELALSEIDDARGLVHHHEPQGDEAVQRPRRYPAHQQIAEEQQGLVLDRRHAEHADGTAGRQAMPGIYDSDDRSAST